MVGIQDWFNVYNAIAGNVGALKSALDGTRAALDEMKADLDSVRANLQGTGDLTNLSLANQITKIAHWIESNLAPNLSNLADTLSPIEGSFALPVLKKLDTLNETLAVGSADQSIQAQAIAKLVEEMTKTASPSLIESWRGFFDFLAKNTETMDKVWKGTFDANEAFTLYDKLPSLRDKLTGKISQAIGMVEPMFDILALPFEAIVTASLRGFKDALIESAPADPSKVDAVAGRAITEAYQFGQKAHLLAAAAELFQPLKQMGFPQMAAALGDLAGFRTVSSVISQATIGASISVPMRYWGNDIFSPWALQVREAITLYQKRLINHDALIRLYQLQGMNHADIDLLVQAAFRDPTIRDLATMIEDTTVDEGWLYSKVQKTGYADDDAQQITNALGERALRTPRNTLISAARANVTDGLLDTESYRVILESVGLRQDRIEMELRTAELTARRDFVLAAINTYRTQYVNDVIARNDFTLALTVLGVNEDRVELIALDADARRAPKIAREEERAFEEPIREIQRELVPRYRRLYELGVISDEAYQNILIEAGISPQVAAQAVILDRQKRFIVISTAQATALEREIASLTRETEGALRLQFRKGLIDEDQLRGSLTDLGYTEDRVRVVVNQERARLAPPPGRVIEAPAEARERVLKDLAIQTALNDFRKGRIEALDLYDELIAQGIDEDEAIARINLEISRLPTAATPTG